MDTESVKELVHELFTSSRKLSQTKLIGLSELKGDASARRFFRLTLDAGPAPTAILMLYPAGLKPLAFPGYQTTHTEVFCMTRNFLEFNAVPVPELYFHDQERAAIIVEDVGEYSLANVAAGDIDESGAEIIEGIGKDAITRLFKKALTITHQIQIAEPIVGAIPFQRAVKFDDYRSSIAGFINGYLATVKAPKGSAEVFGFVFDIICELVSHQPSALTHFDYHGYNIFMQSSGEIKLIDFQDIKIDSAYRDLVTLLNDRSMDECLGFEKQRALLTWYKITYEPPGDFWIHYDEYLLYWDFRVIGLFSRLILENGMPQYKKWLPGTFRRLGRTVLRNQKLLAGMDDILEIMCSLSDEFSEGVGDPWDYTS